MALQDLSLPQPLSDADLTAAKADRDALLQKVQPLLRHFSPEQIRRFTRFGPKSDAFVSEVDAAVSEVGDDLPSAFNAQNFHDALLVMHQIEDLLGPLQAMVDGLSEAAQLVGSFLMQNGNFVYAQLKQLQTLDPRVVPYLEEMARRYEGQRPKPQSAKTN